MLAVPASGVHTGPDVGVVVIVTGLALPREFDDMIEISVKVLFQFAVAIGGIVDGQSDAVIGVDFGDVVHEHIDSILNGSDRLGADLPEIRRLIVRRLSVPASS